ncbi:MAG: dihydroneopterin aldolase [Bacteroidales bacterium]|nr:dihydroneopterin aldolase [Bacteroidales bacterium]
MVRIELNAMEFHAFHGHYREESITGNKFIVDLKVETAKDKACQSDDLTDALDYQKLYEIVKQEMAIRSKLLEHVAQRIKTRVENELRDTLAVSVKIQKVNPPMGGKMFSVSVTL